MTEEQEPQEREVLRGHVKWFDPSKGFGFVVVDQGGPDILLHANVLRNFGQSSIADGSLIEIVTQSTQRGIQAIEVLSIEPPSGDAGTEALAEDAVELAAADPLEPARVKWFDKGKGFGFANAFGRSEDIFIHVEVLRRSGFSDLQPGEAIGVRATDGARGRMAVLVTAWDAAIGRDDET